MLQAKDLARKKGVMLHTHLAETKDEEEYCLQKFNLRPLAYMESLDWVGADVWYAHGIHFNEEELKLLAATKTGVAHCPVSNQKLSSGIAQIPRMLELGVTAFHAVIVDEDLRAIGRFLRQYEGIFLPVLENDRLCRPGRICFGEEIPLR
jgi:cytosine/adenosine deaminase-related metal-dependent hydrolase